MIHSIKSAAGAAALFITSIIGAYAGDLQISAYGGVNETHDSDVKIGPVTHADVPWDGLSFEAPVYWGVRGTYWTDATPDWGFAVDFTHAKVKAASLPPNVTRLEFTDGLNLLTFNAIRRWDNIGQGFDFYAGAGLGLSIPYVEVTTVNNHGSGAGETLNYRFGGPAIQMLAGTHFELVDNVHLFGEYKLSHNWLDASIHGGQRVKTKLLTHHAVVGVSYTFENLGDL